VATICILPRYAGRQVFDKAISTVALYCGHGVLVRRFDAYTANGGQYVFGACNVCGGHDNNLL
jgi:hypothetical protein